MFALTSAIAYLIFRLGMWRVVALACTAGIVWSPANLWAAGLPIEYAKAPWVLLTVLFCGIVFQRDREGENPLGPRVCGGTRCGDWHRIQDGRIRVRPACRGDDADLRADGSRRDSKKVVGDVLGHRRRRYRWRIHDLPELLRPRW